MGPSSNNNAYKLFGADEMIPIKMSVGDYPHVADHSIHFVDVVIPEVTSYSM